MSRLAPRSTEPLATSTRLPGSLVLAVALGMLLVSRVPLAAGGSLETFDITGREPAPTPGEIIARTVPIRWDMRCIPAPIRLNDTLDPVPNPLGADFLGLDEVTAVIERAMGSWNGVPTSFFETALEGTAPNPGLRRFDTVNEVTFRNTLSSPLLGFTRSYTLIEETMLEPGDDVDGDGDSDVAAGIERCADVDGDGDLEFPAGLYPAGTILDSDIELNADEFRFTVEDTDLDTSFFSVDLEAVIVHELGHVQGLAHSLTNQISAQDGTGAVMFLRIDTGDPASQLAARILHVEEVADSSLLYPEGSAAGGPAALGPGDVPFEEVFGVISGETFSGAQGRPLVGASVFAVDPASGERLASTVSGTSRFTFDPATGRFGREDADFSILDGRYVLPVPYGRYRIGIEPIDGTPVRASDVNLTATTGSVFGQAVFPEELASRGAEGATEPHPSRGVTVPVRRDGRAAEGIDLVTERAASLPETAPLERVGLISLGPGGYYAVQVPAEALEELVAAQGWERFALLAARFETFVVDRSRVPRFAEAMLTSGEVAPDGTARIDLDRPLARVAPFVGQDLDLASFDLPAPRGLGQRVEQAIEAGRIEELFLVLRAPLEFPPPSVTPFPPLVGMRFLDAPPAPGLGASYTSDDGELFDLHGTFRFLFDLVVGEVPARRGR